MRPIDGYALALLFKAKRRRKIRIAEVVREIEEAPSICDGLLVTIDGVTGYYSAEFIAQAIKEYVKSAGETAVIS